MVLTRKNDITLTSLSEYCGCSAKMSPSNLNKILSVFNDNDNKNVLVGFDTRDDAGIYCLTKDLAIVSTVDLIVPPVDDPELFGQIAACNALSDIYAMGGVPLFCLNIVCCPESLNSKIIKEILLGLQKKVIEADATIIGGHSLKDPTPKIGLAVTGTVHPDKFWSNKNSTVGDMLILTKPIGSGVLLNAAKERNISKFSYSNCIKSLTQLNKYAADILMKHEIHSATDISGFGLAGHMFEMAHASEVSFQINSKKVPLLPGALKKYDQGFTTSLTLSNLELIWSTVKMSKNVSEPLINLFCDPQTNGGLLVSVPAHESIAILNEMKDKGIDCAEIIGEVIPRGQQQLIFM